MASSLGDPARLSVQRAIYELRAGRAIKVEGDNRSLIIAAAETLGGEGINNWITEQDSKPELILPAPRMKHLQHDVNVVSRVSLDGLSASDIDKLLFAVSPTLPKFEQRAADPLESTALEIVKLTYLLPAAVIFPHVGQLQADMNTVSAQAVDEFHDLSARELSIAARARIPLLEAKNAEFVVFSGGDGMREQIAVIVGEPDPERAVLTRLHSACLTGDLFASLKCDCGDQLRLAIAEISEAGGGVLLYLDQEGRGIGFLNKIRAYRLQELGHDTLAADAVLGYGPDERRYAVASAMLSLLGFQKIILMTNNPEKLKALESFGITLGGHRRLMGNINPHNLRYLTTKARHAGHMLGRLTQ